MRNLMKEIFEARQNGDIDKEDDILKESCIRFKEMSSEEYNRTGEMLAKRYGDKTGSKVQFKPNGFNDRYVKNGVHQVTGEKVAPNSQSTVADGSKSPGPGYKMTFGEWRKKGGNGELGAEETEIEKTERATQGYDPNSVAGGMIKGANKGAMLTTAAGALLGAMQGGMAGSKAGAAGALGGAAVGAIKGAMGGIGTGVAGVGLGALAGGASQIKDDSRSGKFVKQLGTNSMNTMDSILKSVGVAAKGIAIAAAGIGLVALTKNVAVSSAILRFTGATGLSAARNAAHIGMVGTGIVGGGHVALGAGMQIGSSLRGVGKQIKATYNFARNKEQDHEKQ